MGGLMVISALIGLIVGLSIAFGISIFKKHKYNKQLTKLDIENMGTKKESRISKVVKAAKEGNLGDAIKEVTEAVGIEQCEDCAKRQVALNFGDKKKAKKAELSQADRNSLNRFFHVPPNDTDSNSYRFESQTQYKELVFIHNKYFPKAQEQPTNCNPCRVRMIRRLKLLYNG